MNKNQDEDDNDKGDEDDCKHSAQEKNKMMMRQTSVILKMMSQVERKEGRIPSAWAVKYFVSVLNLMMGSMLLGEYQQTVSANEDLYDQYQEEHGLN